MFTKIINPLNNQNYSIYSSQGKQLLKTYITHLNGGNEKTLLRKQHKKKRQIIRNERLRENRRNIKNYRNKLLHKLEKMENKKSSDKEKNEIEKFNIVYNYLKDKNKTEPSDLEVIEFIQKVENEIKKQQNEIKKQQNKKFIRTRNPGGLPTY
tara:strand:+ start:399 stop:857 length:459 start_codon:yes stop_codon:yes gene_type:complete